VENCFNGIDDNCDHLVDCADPQCTAAGVAECIPDPGTATEGVTSTATCPTGYPTGRPLDTGLNAGSCAAGTCACDVRVTGSLVCETSIIAKGALQQDCTRTGGTVVASLQTGILCTALDAGLDPNTYYLVTTPVLDGMCITSTPTGGAPANNSPTWTTAGSFCTRSMYGAGCATGQVCAPAASKHCVLATGNQVACSVTGYSVLDTTPYYSGFDDSARTCACACNINLTCPNYVTFGPTGPFCAGTPVNAGCQNNLAYSTALVPMAIPIGGYPPDGGGVPIECAPGATESGTTSTTGFELTVCCNR
jgi:hypothetical protein